MKVLMSSLNKGNKGKNSFTWKWKAMKQRRCILKRHFFFNSAQRKQLTKNLLLALIESNTVSTNDTN